MIQPLVLHPDARLRSLCAPVLAVDDGVRGLVTDLFDTMYQAMGRGLAAPQIGVVSRAFVMDAGWKSGAASPLAFVNPEILWSSPDQQVNEEGCLSIPEMPVSVTRPARIEVMWLDESGAQRRGAFDGFEAAIVCHEIDHLDGRLILDHEAAA
ncbi:MAG: peptide deformylase [Pseudomonadota bacterium]